MNIPNRIDPDHPLTVASRETNAYADEHGAKETVAWLGVGVEWEQLVYLAEQRALRVIYATKGVNLNPTEMTSVVLDDGERALMPLLTGAYLDAFLIGWRAAQIAATRFAESRPLPLDSDLRRNAHNK